MPNEDTITYENETLYRALCEPFASVDLLNDAASKFQEELYELRKKYRIRELLFVAQSAVIRTDEHGGKTVESPILVGQFGDHFACEILAAYALGIVQTRRQELVAKTMEQALKSATKPGKRSK